MKPALESSRRIYLYNVKFSFQKHFHFRKHEWICSKIQKYIYTYSVRRVTKVMLNINMGYELDQDEVAFIKHVLLLL